MIETVVIQEPLVRVEAAQPGLPGPPGPPGGAYVATGATPPAPAQDGQLWRDPLSGRVMVFFEGAWRGAVLDGQHF